MQSYHFPPPEADPGYGYNNQPLLASQQWSQPGDGQGYELNYQSYAADPSPFARTGHLQPQQGYGQHDVDYGDEFYEDEEPRRSKRWLLIAVALVGAIGVGGALAYTYRSLVAPNSRVPVVRADPNVKIKPEQRGGRDLAAADRKLPSRSAEESAPAKAVPDPAAEEPPTENHGPRAVKTITITPGGSAAPAPPPVAAAPVPGITVYRPPQAAVPAPPPVQPTPKAAPSGRVVIDTRTPPPAETEEDDPPAAAPPPVKRPPVQTALAAPKPPPVAAPKAPAAPKAGGTPSSGGGHGFVAVVSSQKTSMDAMKAYADLQQKYPDVLGDKSFDVQEADLSARGLGTMYRVVVGPPGSHNFASGVCAQLKTAGYVGCWVKEY